MTRGTIETTFHRHTTGLRVRFSCPVDGYSRDDLDALQVAIEHARARMCDEQFAISVVITPTVEPIVAFNEQLSRRTAPS